MDFTNLKEKIGEARTAVEALEKAVNALDDFHAEYGDETNFDELIEMPNGFFRSVSLRKLQTQADMLLAAADSIHKAIRETYNSGNLTEKEKIANVMKSIGVESEDELKAIAKEREDARRQRKSGKK